MYFKKIENKNSVRLITEVQNRLTIWNINRREYSDKSLRNKFGENILNIFCYIYGFGDCKINYYHFSLF